MKAMNYISTDELFKYVSIVTIFLILLVACTNKPERSTTEIPMLHDETENQQAVPDPAEIIPLFHLDADKWNAVLFSSRSVTDVSYTKRTVLTLKAGGNRLRSSSFVRDREVSQFKDSVTALIESLKNDTVGKPHSSIYLPLAEELNRLADSKSERRILLLYSDLLENTPSMSFYNKKTLALLRSNPEKIKAELMQKSVLKKLDGIEVYIVFQPKDAKEDEVFRLVSGFYKTFLTEHGAKVFVVANLSGVAVTQSK